MVSKTCTLLCLDKEHFRRFFGNNLINFLISRKLICYSSSKKIKDEFGGPKGLEPTRYGDWEVNGRVSDF